MEIIVENGKAVLYKQKGVKKDNGWATELEQIALDSKGVLVSGTLGFPEVYTDKNGYEKSKGQISFKDRVTNTWVNYKFSGAPKKLGLLPEKTFVVAYLTPFTYTNAEGKEISGHNVVDFDNPYVEELSSPSAELF